MSIPAFHLLSCDILQSALSTFVLICKNKYYFIIGVLVFLNNVMSVGTLFALLKGSKLIFIDVNRY